MGNPYLCNGERELSLNYIVGKIIKKRYAYLVKLKPEKFRIDARRKHSGSHAIAWAAIIHTCIRVSQDLNFRRGHCSSTLRDLLMSLRNWKGTIFLAIWDG